MADDQERCEWVNVSSGTVLPGKSRTKGCKTVVVRHNVTTLQVY